MSDPQKSGVIHYYDTHPINEDEILSRLKAQGIALETLTEDALKDFDQDHYGGIDVVDVLAERAGIRAEHHVLDVCSGMGGPARWLAHRIGCRVTGLDFTLSRVEAARRLTALVKLDDKVDFVHGDATAMPFAAASFDILISQEAWLHIPTKPALIAECARVVKPGGIIAFTDTVILEPLSAEDEARVASGMHAPALPPVERYFELLRANNCQLEQHDDLSAQWRDTLVQRLAMYRSLRELTVAKFGLAHFEDWDHIYSHYVGLFVAGKLGGARIVARRLP
ncbi:MAG: methyltransferase domain-containing protein [Gammaproteobacteria bacterium]